MQFGTSSNTHDREPGGRSQRSLGLASSVAVLAAILVAALGGLLATSSPASADSHGCGDNVCVTFKGGASTTVTVETWAYAQSFDGYFTLTGPRAYSESTTSQSWNGGDETDSHTFTIAPEDAVDGTWCVTATGADGSNYGTACEHVS